MQKFRNRILFYGVGFAIGLVLMFMMFGNRGCSWLPENRVKNMIAEKEILVGDSLLEVMNCSGITNEDVYALLKDDGDVDFSLSVTDKVPKEYWIGGTKAEQPYSVIFALGDSLVEIIDFNYVGKANCTSALSNLHKTAVPLPDEDVIAIIESNEMRILPKAECQITCLNFKKEEVLNFHRTASIEMELSKPRLYPNAEYVLKGIIQGKEVFITYVIGENRTRVADISPNECGCTD